MAARAEPFLPVEAQGLLRFDAPTGRTVGVRALGSELHVEVPGWAEIKAALPASPRLRRQSLRVADSALRTYGLKLSMHTSGRPFLQLGHDTSANWLARLLGLAPANIRLSAIALFLRR